VRREKRGKSRVSENGEGKFNPSYIQGRKKGKGRKNVVAQLDTKGNARKVHNLVKKGKESNWIEE